MKQNEDAKYAELAMKITSDRTLWMMRAFVLKNMLEKLGVDAEWVFDTSKEELEAMLKAEQPHERS